MRGDLLLPSDSLSSVDEGRYLAVREPKTALRGRGKVQHICVKEAGFVGFLERVLAEVVAEEPLPMRSESGGTPFWSSWRCQNRLSFCLAAYVAEVQFVKIKLVRDFKS